MAVTMLQAAARCRCALAVLAFAPLAGEAQESAATDADIVHEKIALVRERGQTPRDRDAPPVHTAFADRELNDYFDTYGHTFLPPGIANPKIQIGDGGRVRARAVVDLDAVRRARTRDWLDPLAYLTGSLEVVATGALVAANGAGIVRLESASVAGVTVPRTVVQELLRFYTTTQERPEGFSLDEPFELPAGVRSAVLERGRVTLVQ